MSFQSTTVEPATARVAQVADELATVHAYLAGVLDSDGSVCIAHEAAAEHQSERFALRLGVGQTRTDAILLFVETFGGKMSTHRPSAKTTFRHRQPMFRYMREGKAAAAILLALAPYIRVKRPELAIAREFAATIRPDSGRPPGTIQVRLPLDVIEKRRLLWHRMRALHSNGGKGHVRPRQMRLLHRIERA